MGMKQEVNHTKGKPIVGIVICGFENQRQFVTDNYVQVIRCSGGIPIIIPFIRSSAIAKEYAAMCQGFLFCGGDDIAPLLFGEQPQIPIGTINMNFDIFQIILLRYIMKLRKPIFGICRGMQVLNVALRGSIYQDMSLYPGHTLQHMQINSNRQEVSHRIKIKRKTKLYKILGPTLYTNSFHHQAIHKLGKGITATAWSNDGIIEGIEHMHSSFVIGVQWHPECMVLNSKPMGRLFQEFIRQSQSEYKYTSSQNPS